MAYTFVSSKQLKGLLNDVERVHKKDINDYTAGHLNDMHLHQHAAQINRKSWASAAASHMTRKPAVVEKPAEISYRDSPMKEALFQFSLGTAGSVPYPSPQGKTSRSPTKRWAKFKDGRSSTTSDKSVYSEIEDEVLVEELQNDKMMIPTDRSKCIDAHKSDLSPRLFVKKSSVRHMFIPMQSFGITRLDQYQNMKDFESCILRTKDTSEKNILLGMKKVQHHEKKLKQQLTMYDLHDTGPNFHKLQVYSDIFEDVIQESPTFSYILGCIKVEYDNYITKLLDSQTTQHHLLQEQVEQMASRGTSRPKDLRFIIDKLKSLETIALDELHRNTALREQLKQESEWLANFTEQESAQSSTVRSIEEVEADLADEVEHVKALILEKLDAVNALRTELKDNCVPLTVCTHLEQCIKETEIEVQKLLKQNEYYERSIAEMESDLKLAIVDADTSEKDAKRIWRKVNSRKGVPGVGTKAANEESDDDDEESKWNWYIS